MALLKIAIVPIARVNFDMELARRLSAEFQQNARSYGFEVVGPADPITDADGAKSIAGELAGEDFDTLLVFQATFADSSIITTLVEAIDRPIFLWSVPEERTGGRLRLNSLCGINLAAHALTLRGIPYEFAYAPHTAAAAFDKVRVLAAAGRVLNRLKHATFGVVGEHPDGMDTCHLDEAALQRVFGVHVVRIPLQQVLDQVRSTPEAATAPARAALAQKLDNLDTLDPAGVNGTLSTYLALQQIGREQHLSGIAVRCWPEFFTDLKCAACGAISMLTDENLPCSCEADINGTMTQAILQWLSDEPAMGTDLVAVDADADEFVLWHCGLAPLSMADPVSKPRGIIHSNRKVPLLMEFTLKPGKVTLARLSQATGELRMVVTSGEMLASTPSFSGTSGIVRFGRPADQVLEDILRHGLEHHLAFTYGEHAPALLKLAELLKLPVLTL